MWFRRLNALYEVVWVAWGNHVVPVRCFYEDAVPVIRNHHERSSNAWEVVVFAVEACSEKPEPERNQRSLHRLNCFQRNPLRAADESGCLQNEFAIRQDVPCPVNRGEKPEHQALNKDCSCNQHDYSDKAVRRLLCVDKIENDSEHHN